MEIMCHFGSEYGYILIFIFLTPFAKNFLIEGHVHPRPGLFSSNRFKVSLVLPLQSGVFTGLKKCIRSVKCERVSELIRTVGRKWRGICFFFNLNVSGERSNLLVFCISSQELHYELVVFMQNGSFVRILFHN